MMRVAHHAPLRMTSLVERGPEKSDSARDDRQNGTATAKAEADSLSGNDKQKAPTSELGKEKPRFLAGAFFFHS